MSRTEAPSFDASRIMQNPGDTNIPESVDLKTITVDGKRVPVRKIYILNGDEAVLVDPSKYDAVVRLGDSIHDRTR